MSALGRNGLRQYACHGAVIMASAGLAVMSAWLGASSLSAMLALAIVLVPIAVVVHTRWPETGVYLILALVAFGSEYSQTQWGVRSADQLRTIYNWRVLPGLTASLFDLIFAAVLGSWLVQKWLRREGLPWLPAQVAVPGLLSLAFVFYATVLGLYSLPQGFELYYILRELRPFIFALALLVMAVDVIVRHARAGQLWRLIVALAFLRGVQGVIRHLQGIGRFYHGTIMVYYDYADTLLLLAGMSLLLAWLLTRPRLRLGTLVVAGLAAAPMLYAFVFSYRRSFWIGAAAGLGLLFFAAAPRERRRVLTLALVGAVGLAGMVWAAGQGALVTQRVASIVDAEGDTSNYFRVLDTQNSLLAVYEWGGVGMGFGSRYRIVATVHWLADFIGHVSRASHNGYLYLAMKMGLWGLLAWTGFWLGHLDLCRRLLGRPGGPFRHVGLACGLVLVASGVANLFLPLYYNLRPMLLLSIFCALAISAWRAGMPTRQPA